MKKLILSLIVLFSFYSNIFSQWSNNPNQNLQISSSGIHVNACEDGMGGAFVCWTTADSYYREARLQWVDKYGYLRWNQPLHITGNGVEQSQIKLIKSETGKVVITFIDCIEVGWDSLVWQPIFHTYLRTNKIDTTGLLYWGERGITVTTDTALTYELYSVVEDEDNGIYISWKNIYSPSYISSQDSTVLRVQKISNQGIKLWGNKGKYICTRYGYNFPEFYISRRKSDGIFLRYYNQNYDNILESINPDMSIRWSKVNEWYWDLVPDENGGGAWARKIDQKIIINKITVDGDLVWGDSGIVIDDNLDHLLAVQDYKIIKDSSLIVLWQKRRTDNPSNFNSYLQIIDKNGLLLFCDSVYSIKDTNYNVVGGKIILSDSTNFIIVWKEGITDESKYFAQKYNRNVEELWNLNDLVCSLTTHESRSIIPDRNGGFIDAFAADFPEPLGVFIQQVSKNGILGEVITSIQDDNINNGFNFTLRQNYPNPFNPSTSISYKLPKAANVTVKVFDVLGKQVATLVNEEKPSGSYNVEFNGYGLASGIYYYQIKAGEFIQTKKMILLK